MTSQPAAATARVPPSNLKAEQAILGAMLLDTEAIGRAEELLAEDDFYRVRHQVLFRTILELAAKGEAVDLVTLEDALSKGAHLEECGGFEYLQELFDAVITTQNVDQYAKIIKQKAQLRKLIETSHEIAGACYEEQEDLDQILDRAESSIFKVTQSRVTRPYHGMKETVAEAFAVVERLYDRKQAITGTPSGLRDLDKITTGFQPSDLIILAARPSMGKTALALTFAVNAAVYEKVATIIFSLEMSRVQLAIRMLSMESRIDGQLLRQGMFREEHWSSLTMAAGMLSEAPLFIDDSPQVSIREMRSKCRRLKAEHDLGLIIVDYLQLMEVRDRKVESRQMEISYLSRSMKELARELNVPILALSQLSRKVEDRTDKRPMLSDLRESGAIEQDADLVMFIYREDRYKQNTDEKGVAEIIIAKQRNGPVGTVKAQFSDKYGKFHDLAMGAEE